jgi:hypothetical protein
MTASPRVTSGQLLMATGVVHQLVGVLVGLGLGDELGGRNLFAEIAGAGGVAAIEPDLGRMTLFWFLFFGFAMLMLGSLMHHNERRGQVLPESLGWQMGALAIAGGLLIPASGFWLIIPQGLWIVRRARRREGTAR